MQFGVVGPAEQEWGTRGAKGIERGGGEWCELRAYAGTGGEPAAETLVCIRLDLKIARLT